MKHRKAKLFGLHKEQSAFMKSKKGADLSMNVIIIAAIALLVLVILAVLLFRSGGQVSEGTSCTGYGGECSYVQPSSPGNWIKNPAFSSTCEGESNYCWVKLG